MRGITAGARPPGMRDVARAAGVSHQTVSRVLNEPETVRPETRDRVLAAMSEMGYRRNLAARALVSGQSAQVGVVWTGAHFYGPSTTVAGIEIAARAAGYSTIVGALTAGREDEVDVIVEGFLARGVDGVAIVTPHRRMFDLVAERVSGLPTVLVGDLDISTGFHCVTVDQEAGARLATQHLIDGGATRVAHVTGPLDWFDATSRVRGWRSTLEEAGLLTPEPIEADWSPESGFAAAAVLAEDLPDAVFCANDLVALGVVKGLADRGLRIPVVGYDDVAGSAYFRPPLTTVRQPSRRWARCRWRCCSGPWTASRPRDTLGPELIVRESSTRG